MEARKKEFSITWRRCIGSIRRIHNIHVDFFESSEYLSTGGFSQNVVLYSFICGTHVSHQRRELPLFFKGIDNSQYFEIVTPLKKSLKLRAWAVDKFFTGISLFFSHFENCIFLPCSYLYSTGKFLIHRKNYCT